MFLNTLQIVDGSRPSKQRVGRGIGCGAGKTCKRGHKGQTSRAGGYHKVGFEGGQMPLQRRLPKYGFNSALARQTTEIRLDALAALECNEITLDTLKKADLLRCNMKRVKVVNSGSLDKAITLKGIKATQSAIKVIESLGGKVED